MTDRATKLLLAVIALGLWANVATALFLPMAAVAQSDELSEIKSDVSSIESSVFSIEGNVSNIEGHVGRIPHGTCTNSKIC